MKASNIDYKVLIKEYRENNFLTQEELAKKLNVSYVTVSRWEKGLFKPSLKQKRKLFNLFKECKMIED